MFSAKFAIICNELYFKFPEEKRRPALNLVPASKIVNKFVSAIQRTGKFATSSLKDTPFLEREFM